MGSEKACTEERERVNPEGTSRTGPSSPTLTDRSRQGLNRPAFATFRIKKPADGKGWASPCSPSSEAKFQNTTNQKNETTQGERT